MQGNDGGTGEGQRSPGWDCGHTGPPAGTGGPGRDSAGAGAIALSDADLRIIGFVPAGATAPDDALAAVSTAPAAPGAALAADAAAPAAALASGSGWGGGGGALGTGAAREQADAVPQEYVCCGE